MTSLCSKSRRNRREGKTEKSPSRPESHQLDFKGFYVRSEVNSVCSLRRIHRQIKAPYFSSFKSGQSTVDNGDALQLKSLFFQHKGKSEDALKVSMSKTKTENKT